MKFWSNLGLVRTLKLGEFKENRSLSFRDIGVRDSELPIWGMASAISNTDISKTERTIFFKLAQFQGPDQS